ncbi:hypothetical protein T08_9644, partial [Trichinella sp. T8]
LYSVGQEEPTSYSPLSFARRANVWQIVLEHRERTEPLRFLQYESVDFMRNLVRVDQTFVRPATRCIFHGVGCDRGPKTLVDGDSFADVFWFSDSADATRCDCTLEVYEYPSDYRCP